MTPAEIASLFETPKATAVPKRRARPEAAIQRAIVRTLERHGVLCERRTVGFDRERGITYGTRGEPDLRLSWRGRTCGVEVKAPCAGRLADHQRAWHDRHADHVPTWVVDSVAGAERVLSALTGPTWPVPGADLRGLP